MERYFQTISAIGELFIEKILFEFDKEPIVFVCRNYKMDRYLCLCTDSIESYSWMVTHVSIDTLIDLLLDKISILQAFKYSSDEVYILDKLGNKTDIRKYRFEDIPEDELPDEKEKLENKNINEYLSKLYYEKETYHLNSIRYNKIELSHADDAIIDNIIFNTEKKGVINVENLMGAARFSAGKREMTNNRFFFISVKQDNLIKTKHYDKKTAVAKDWNLTLV